MILLRNLLAMLNLAFIRTLSRIGLLLLLAIPLGASRPAPFFLPLDNDRLNVFAQAYNVYAQEIIDERPNVKSWEKVEKAWRQLHLQSPGSPSR